MRLAFVLPSMDAGGAQRQFAQLAPAMAGRGHDVLFATFAPGGPHWDALAAVAGVRLVALAGRGPAGRLGIGHRLPATTLRLARTLRRNRTEIVYSALHIANLLVWLATGGGRTVPLCWGLRAARQDLPWRRRLPYELCRLGSGRVERLIANSAAGLADHGAHGYRARRAEVIPNGIDVGKFRPDLWSGRQARAEWGFPEGARVVGIVGRLVAVKDHPTFLAAAARLSVAWPDARFVVVGDGPAAYRAGLVAEAGRLGLADRLCWAGERRDMARVYNGLDLLCLSSRSEGFPNVTAEAMACGVPAVATDVGDVAALLGETGEVVPPGDPAALAGAVARALALAGDQRRRLGEAVRSRVVERYGLAAMVERTEAALADALARHRASRPRPSLAARVRTSGGRAG
jgi:glycosyltransferase involved in cell wall biosynthesis